NADAVGLQGLDFLNGDLVVAVRVDIGTQLAEVLHEVVGEGIVVVEHEEFHGADLSDAGETHAHAQAPGMAGELGGIQNGGWNVHRQFSLVGAAVPEGSCDLTLSTGTATRCGLRPQQHAASYWKRHHRVTVNVAVRFMFGCKAS